MLRVFTSQMSDDKFGFLRSCCGAANIRQPGWRQRFLGAAAVIEFGGRCEQSHEFIRVSLFHSLSSDM